MYFAGLRIQFLEFGVKFRKGSKKGKKACKKAK
jgi:hypothetical protein